MQHNNSSYPELIVGLVGAVGTNLRYVVAELERQLACFDYAAKHIKISDDIITTMDNVKLPEEASKYVRTKTYMDSGDKICSNDKDGKKLARGALKCIRDIRKELPEESKVAYIIDSFKRPEEVQLFRKVYGNGFFLIGVYSDKARRIKYLVDARMKESEALELIERDENGGSKESPYGQNTRATFQLSDFFVDFSKNDFSETGDSSGFARNQLERIIRLLFGDPFVSPTFGEFAMFTAYSSSLRSVDLSRQIGAAIVRDNEVLSTGVNEVPKFGGGVYVPYVSKETHEYIDFPSGRDYMVGYDPNKREIENITEDIIRNLPTGDLAITLTLKDAINKSTLKDLTEYSRVVHAEMEALSMCARNGISTKGSKMYVTTFPCHTCAKLILAAGIVEVVYIEPYPKSKSLDLFPDSISTDENERSNKMLLTPFFGVAPTRYVDMFSMIHGILTDRQRKYSKDIESDGKIIHRKGERVAWEPSNDKTPRYSLPKISYLETEDVELDKIENDGLNEARKEPWK